MIGPIISFIGSPASRPNLRISFKSEASLRDTLVSRSLEALSPFRHRVHLRGTYINILNVLPFPSSVRGLKDELKAPKLDEWIAIFSDSTCAVCWSINVLLKPCQFAKKSGR